MRAALSSFTYPWAVGVPGSPPASPLSAEDLLRKAAALGVPVVQLADNLDPGAMPAATLEKVTELADALGVTIEVGTRGIGTPLADALTAARHVGASFVRVVLDTASEHSSPEEAIDRLRLFEREFRAAGMTLAIENHDRFSTAELAMVVAELGDWAGICLDTVNSFGALEPPEAVVEALGPLAVNLHIKDFTIRRPDHQMGFLVEGTPAGAGMLDIPALVRTLDGFGRVTAGVLELWTPPEATIEETIEKEQRWAETSVRYLREATSLEFVSPGISAESTGRPSPPDERPATRVDPRRSGNQTGR